MNPLQPHHIRSHQRFEHMALLVDRGWLPRLGRIELAVLIAFETVADQDGIALGPSDVEIATMVGHIRPSQVESARRTLESNRLIRVQRSATPDRPAVVWLLDPPTIELFSERH